MSISTGTGDDGTTSLAGGERVRKDHIIIECLGTLDELNSFLGSALCYVESLKTRDNLRQIQKDLFRLGSILAGCQIRQNGMAPEAGGENSVVHEGTELSGKSKNPADRSHTSATPPGAALILLADETAELTERIRELEALSPGKGFVFPGSSKASAKLHICRTLCRRLERRLVTLRESCGLPEGVIPYVNRLSDLLFLLAETEESSTTGDRAGGAELAEK